MPKGVYAAASAMLTETRALEAVTQNLANLQTPGYRKASAMRGSFAHLLAAQGRTETIGGNGGAGIRDVGIYRSHNQGQLEESHAPLDLAISGEGFYRVRNKEGNVLLTRAAHFTTDNDGHLATDEGYIVEGQGGPILIPADTSRVVVDESGRVVAESRDAKGMVIETFIDQLRVVTVPDPSQMRAVSGQYFTTGEQAQTDAPANAYAVRQGFLERANVEPVEELVRMISIQRRYDAAQRALKQQDEAGRGFSDLLRGA